MQKKRATPRNAPKNAPQNLYFCTTMSLSLLRQLHYEYFRRTSTAPDYAYPKPSYTDKTANGLTKCILDYCKFKGYHAERVAVTGRWVADKYHPKGGRWIKSSMMVGTADIHCIINGRAVMVEVKVGKDRQSDMQKKYAEKIAKSGGIYLIVRTFEDFLNQITPMEDVKDLMIDWILKNPDKNVITCKPENARHLRWLHDSNQMLLHAYRFQLELITETKARIHRISDDIVIDPYLAQIPDVAPF